MSNEDHRRAVTLKRGIKIALLVEARDEWLDSQEVMEMAKEAGHQLCRRTAKRYLDSLATLKILSVRTTKKNGGTMLLYRWAGWPDALGF